MLLGMLWPNLCLGQHSWNMSNSQAGKSYKYGQLHEEAFQQHAPLDMQMAHKRTPAEGLLFCMR